MTRKTWQISRRTMLRGVGAMISVPLLEAMGPAVARAADVATGSAGAGAAAGRAAGKPPVRMAVLYMPNGVNEKAWMPKGAGAGFELSPTLQPLAKLKREVLVLSELMNAGSIGGDGHYVKTAAFLTGTTITKTTGKDLRSGGVSMDQVAAQRIGRQTPLPSLELGIDTITTGIDNNVGYTRLYGSHIAWSTPTTPLGKEINPRLAFDRLFRSNAASGQRAADDRSVLDLVADDASRLRARVGKADQRKLDDYLESVRAVEKRIEFNNRERSEQHAIGPQTLKAIEALDKRVEAYVGHPDRQKHVSLNQGFDHTEHVRLMLDLMVLAFWSDSTRISTFMFGNAVSPRNFSFLDGVRGGHHQISHHKNEKELLEQYQRINRWHVEQYAYMLERMQSIKEGEGTLLDNSMVLFGSGMRDGNRHDPHNLPVVLAGRAGGSIRPGRHVAYERKTRLCNLYATMLDHVGAPVKQFGDSTDKLPGLDDPSFAGNRKADA